MYKHNQSVIIKSSIQNVYSIVANIENYPNFIPWISSVKQIDHILNTSKNENPYTQVYQVKVNFKIAQEKFTTKDTFYKNEKIIVELLEGPFKHLKSMWEFIDIENNTTKVNFNIEFDFKSKILSLAFGQVFLIAQQKIFNYFISQLNTQTEIK
jgi:coenzyme Q-binding protein COQ10